MSRSMTIDSAISSAISTEIIRLFQNNTEAIIEAIKGLPGELFNPQIFNEIVNNPELDTEFEEFIASGVQKGITDAVSGIMKESYIENLVEQLGDQIAKGLGQQITDFQDAVTAKADEYQFLLLGIAAVGAIVTIYKDDIKSLVKNTTNRCCSKSFCKRLFGGREKVSPSMTDLRRIHVTDKDGAAVGSGCSRTGDLSGEIEEDSKTEPDSEIVDLLVAAIREKQNDPLVKDILKTLITRGTHETRAIHSMVEAGAGMGSR